MKEHWMTCLSQSQRPISRSTDEAVLDFVDFVPSAMVAEGALGGWVPYNYKLNTHLRRCIRSLDLGQHQNHESTRENP